MRLWFKLVAVGTVAVLWIGVSRPASCQLSLPSFGQKNAGSNDQKVNKLLHENLPLVLDANTAYPTVPNQDLLGGPFRGSVLPITLDTLTKPLPPGDYVLPMTFFCSEYSIHRPGAGTAYVLAPAKGTAATAISTLLWRGMLAGHKPQELQSVSWAIQGSVAYDKMPASYRALIDQLIPDMKNQVNGQAFADIEDGFQGKVNRFTKTISGKMSDGLGKVTGGRGHVDIRVDVELNESFHRLGRLGQMALDGESLSSIVTAAYPSDDARERALYAGQGTQAPPLPAANGPWSVVVPGVAYMRFVVHGGNLQHDNIMQIRIISPKNSTMSLDHSPRLVLAQYPQNTLSTPSLTTLVNGKVNQAALSQCLATNSSASMCVANSTDFGGLAAYSVATGMQSPLVGPAGPAASTPATSKKICVKKALYEPIIHPDPHDKNMQIIGLCLYLAAVEDTNGSCGSDSEVAFLPADQKLNWVQTYQTNADGDANNPPCSLDTAHKDPCKSPDIKEYGPLFRPDRDPKPSPQGQNYLYSGGPDFENWKYALRQQGTLDLLFRDAPQRGFQYVNGNLGPRTGFCADTKNASTPGCLYYWHTTNEQAATHYENPSPTSSIAPSKGAIDNHLRLVSFAKVDADPDHFDYTPLLRIEYGFKVDRRKGQVVVDPLVIAGRQVDNGGPISLEHLQRIDSEGSAKPTRLLGGRPSACTNLTVDVINGPPAVFTPFPYDPK